MTEKHETESESGGCGGGSVQTRDQSQKTEPHMNLRTGRDRRIRLL